MKKTKQSNSTPRLPILKELVKPSIKTEGDHPIEEYLSNGKEITAIGMVNLGEGKANNWVSYKLKLKGIEVVSLEVDEPNDRRISEEMSKVNFVETFMGVE